MKSYEDFSLLYDELMEEVPYEKWIDFVEARLNESVLTVKLIVELGAGTGNMTIPLAKKGYEMIGIDLSESMLMVANEKAMEEDVHILFLQQNMCEFDLYGSVDAVLSTCDSMNYLKSIEEVQKVVKKAHYFLNPGGMFIFDMNTEYKFREIYKNQNFSEVGENFAYIWENTYDEKEKINFYDIAFFVEEESGRYTRFEEHHEEYVYGIKDMKEILQKQGFEVTIYNDYEQKEVDSKAERVTFVCKK